ncbi:MAG: RuvX/YqgF family protein [Oscillospiraceae bacterium]|nr:RuvX/YqgF family protein [Oscillospiraceae bacterium]
MVVLSVDYGDARCGVAVSDPLQMTATGLRDVTMRRGALFAFRSLCDIISERSVGLVVVGLPFNMDGSLGPSALKVIGFADRLISAMEGSPDPGPAAGAVCAEAFICWWKGGGYAAESWYGGASCGGRDVGVTFWDERLTTRSAQRTLIGMGKRDIRRGGSVDKAASEIILTGYLDRLRLSGKGSE